MNSSPPGSSVHRILQARILEWVAISFSASMWNQCNCVEVWTFFGIALLWDWNENWPFPVLWPMLSFPNLLQTEWSTKETQMYTTVFWNLWERVGDFGEWHWNMYNIINETSCQLRFNAWYWMLGAAALGWPRGMVQGVRREGDSGWWTRVYLWQIHVDVWQNQYNIVK